VLSQAYDLVWNGWELGSGSIRIHRSDLQQRVFSVAGITPEEAQDRFGFLLEVMRMGAPPHGGFALGLDRFLALLADEPNIREVVAFPKASSGSELMTGAPTEVPHEQLRELGVRTLHPGR
jgi:aspartyl-tRNA synthetase